MKADRVVLIMVVKRRVEAMRDGMARRCMVGGEHELREGSESSYL